MAMNVNRVRGFLEDTPRLRLASGRILGLAGGILMIGGMLSFLASFIEFPRKATSLEVVAAVMGGTLLTVIGAHIANEARRGLVSTSHHDGARGKGVP